MQKPVLAGGQVDEGAEGLDVHHGAQIHLAHLDLLHDAVDDPLGLGRRRLVGGGDGHGAVVLDVDLHAGLGNDAVDGLAAGTDDVADLVGVDLEADDPGRVGRKLRPGRAQALAHLVQDEQPSAAGLGQGPGEDLLVDALDLDIHLDGGDAVTGAGHLEVHVAQEVFETLDVGEHGDVAGVHVLDEAHGHARHHLLDGHARVHKGQGAGADAGLGGGTVAGDDLGNQPHAVGELLLAGEHGQQGPLRQGAVADLTPAGAAHGAGFAGAVGRHVVLVHVALGILQADAVQDLGLGDGAQCGDGHDLGLAPGEHGAAVGPLQDARLAPDGPDLLLAAAVGTDLLVDDLVPHDLFGHVVEDGVDVLALLGMRFVEGGVDLGLHLLGALFPLLAVEGVHLPDDLVHGERADGLVQLLGGLVDVDLHLGLADLVLDALDEGADLLDLLMGKEDGAQHLLLGELLGPGFHHHDRVLGAGHGQGQAALFPIFHTGVEDVFPVHIAHGHGARGAHEGGFGDGQGDGGAQHGDDVGLHVLVHGQAGGDDLHVVVEALGEQGAQRPVDEPVGQDGLLGGAAFPLDEAAGDLAHGVELLFKFNGQGQKIHAVPGGFGHGGADQHRGAAAAHQAGAACLLGILAGLDDELAIADHGFELFEHSSFYPLSLIDARFM